jgi:penicillin-binding protein A
MKNRDIEKNIRGLAVFFGICFLSIIVYLTYFNIFVGKTIINDSSNRRIKAAENEILRGSILDRNGVVLAYSKRDADGNQTRKYEYNKMLSHVIGYNSYIYGKTGVEREYNSELQGKNTGYDILGSIFKTIKETVNQDEKRGNDIYLTIDSKLQETAYDSLGDNKGAAVALNPKTGEVLALVSKPSFELEGIDQKFKQYNSDEKNTPFVNRATQGYYPPGSTFKIITASSALENISDIENQSFKCNGGLKIGNYILKDHNGVSHWKIKIDKAFRVSCNYTFASIGIELGFDKLKATAEKFMFNKEIETKDKYPVLNIKEGTINTDDVKSKAQTAQDAIGQNMVSANPMHMALVAGAIANDGIMMKPYLIGNIKDRYGMSVMENQTAGSVLSNAVSSEIATKIKQYMIDTVKKGTGVNAKISGITVAGKTGTAEDGEKVHSWFVAFAPAENPQIAVAVIVENGGTGGQRAAKVVRNMIKEYVK